MGKSINVTVDMYETVFSVLDENFKGVDLVLFESKKANKSFIRVRNVTSKVSFLLKRKDINKWFKYIKENESIKVIPEFTDRFVFMKGQVKNDNNNDNSKSCKSNKKDDLDFKKNVECIDIKTIDSKSEVVLLDEHIKKCIDDLFTKGKLEWDAKKERYTFSYQPKKKAGKKKPKMVTILLRESLSSQLNSLNNMGPEFFKIIEVLKETYPAIHNSIKDFYVTPECFLDENREGLPIDELKKKIYLWNEMFTENVFTLNDFEVLYKGKPLKRSNFVKFIKAKDSKSLIDAIIGVYSHPVDNIKYLGSELLDSFYDENSKDDINRMKSYIDNLKNISLSNIRFIVNNYEFFYEDRFSQNILENIVEYKKEADSFKLSEIRYYKNIEIKFGPFTVLYTEKDGTVNKDCFYNHIIEGTIDYLIAISKSKIINRYNKIKKEIVGLKDDIYKNIINKIKFNFNLDNMQLEYISKYIDESLRVCLNLDVYIKDGTDIYINDLCVSDLLEDDMDALFNDIAKEIIDYLYALSEAYILSKKEEDKRLEDILNVYENCLVVSCIADLKKKGITTYANILSGKKTVVGDDKYFGKLKEEGYNFVLEKIESLIKDGVLSVLLRKASFGIYESIEVRESVKVILDRVNNVEKEEALTVEEDIYCTLKEFIENTNNLKRIKSNLILKTIDVEDIKYLVEVFSDGVSISKSVISDIADIMKHCEELNQETIFFIKFKLNIVKKPSLKSFLSEILVQNDAKRED